MPGSCTSLAVGRPPGQRLDSGNRRKGNLLRGTVSPEYCLITMVKKQFLVLAFCFLAFALGAAPKKIVLIAGPLDDHGPGTHEYENNVRVLEHSLRGNSEIKTEVHFNGWPQNLATLDDAA